MHSNYFSKHKNKITNLSQIILNVLDIINSDKNRLMMITKPIIIL